MTDSELARLAHIATARVDDRVRRLAEAAIERRLAGATFGGGGGQSLLLRWVQSNNVAGFGYVARKSRLRRVTFWTNAATSPATSSALFDLLRTNMLNANGDPPNINSNPRVSMITGAGGAYTATVDPVAQKVGDNTIFTSIPAITPKPPLLGIGSPLRVPQVFGIETKFAGWYSTAVSAGDLIAIGNVNTGFREITALLDF